MPAEAGRIAVSKASQLVDCPPDEQRKLLAGGRAITRPPRGASGGRLVGADCDQLIVHARQVQDLITGQFASARTLIESGCFDSAVVLTAVAQLEGRGDQHQRVDAARARTDQLHFSESFGRAPRRQRSQGRGRASCAGSRMTI
jgi:hypothetical protein